MKEYQKIETLYKFNSETKKYELKFYNPIVEYLKDNKWLASEKIDGTNIRVHWDGHNIEFGGRTDNGQLSKKVYDLLRSKFKDTEIIFEQNFGEKEVFLFMECYGGSIQSHSYGGEERLIGFDVMVGNIYLDKTIISDIFDLFKIDTVKFYEIDNLNEAIKRVQNYTDHNTVSMYNAEGSRTPIEGLVCVPAMRLYDHQGKRIIVKIKCKDFRKLDK